MAETAFTPEQIQEIARVSERSPEFVSEILGKGWHFTERGWVAPDGRLHRGGAAPSEHTLGNWAKRLAPFAAFAAPVIAGAGGSGTPQTGGPSTPGGSGPSIWSRIAQMAGPAANVASAASAGRAGGRAEEAANARAEDELALRRAQFARDTPRIRANQAALGDLLANVQDIDITVPGVAPSTISGGLRPSALGPNARQAGSNLSAQALQAMLSGSDVPDMGTRPEPNWIDRALNIGSTIGTGIGLVNHVFRPTVPAPAPTPPTAPANSIDPVGQNRRGWSPNLFGGR